MTCIDEKFVFVLVKGGQTRERIYIAENCFEGCYEAKGDVNIDNKM